MDPVENGTAEDPRVGEIRRDIERARARIAEAVDALEYKADVPARLGDVLSATASNITARVLSRLPTTSAPQREAVDEAAVVHPAIRE